MKIFKKLLPVVIGLSVILVIAITIVIVSVATNKTPKLSNGKETYLQYGDLTVTKQDLYDALKKDYSVSELTRLIDTYLYSEELKSIDDKELQAYIEDDLYGEDFTGDKQEEWDEVIKSLILTGVVTEADAKAAPAYDAYSGAVWQKVKQYYSLQYAREQWAKKEIVSRLEAERLEEGLTGLFDEEDMEEYFEDNFGATSYGLFIPFSSKAAADAMLEKYGINPDASISKASGSQLAGWVRNSYDTENNEYPSVNDYLRPDEVIDAFIGMYNEVLSYLNDGEDIITSDLYTTTYSEKRTAALVKTALNEQVNKYLTLTKCLVLPTTCAVNGVETGATIKWTTVDEENFKLTEDGILTVTSPTSKLTKEVTATITLGEAETTATYKFTIAAKATIEEESTTLTLPQIEKVYDYSFVNEAGEYTLSNELANGYAQLVWEITNDSDFATYLTAASTELTLSTEASEFYKSYSVVGEEVGDYYCLFIKLAETEAPTYEDSKQAVIDAMTEDLYGTDDSTTNLEEMCYVRRQEAGLQIYDEFIEAIYEYNYDYFYSTTLGVTEYPEFKISKKTKSKIVASVDGYELTVDDFYAVLEEKFGPTYVKSYIDQYLLLNSDFNTFYNPWKDVEDKAYVKSLLKSDINSFKQNFELDYFTYSYLSYYGFIPNFPASYGWKNFIHDYFGANSEKELLINKNYGGKIYSEVLEAYTESLYDYADLKAEMDKTLEDFYRVDVMNLIISVDFDFDGEPDTKIVPSNEETTTKENWTETQLSLVQELAALIMENYHDVLATGSLSEKLVEVVNVYNDAPYQNIASTTLEEKFGKYKLAGLSISFESTTTYDYSSSLVEEFVDAMVAMWNYANDNGLVYDDDAAEENSNYTNPIIDPIKYNVTNENGDYAFASSYGYHVVAVEKAYQPVDLPTEDEIKLYEAANKLTEAKTNLESAKTNMESATGNETAVASYKEQIKQYEAEIEKYTEEVKALEAKLEINGFDEETGEYTLDEEISEKCSAWYDTALTEVETYIVEKELLAIAKKEITASNFENGFDMDQFTYYLNYLEETYNETNE